MKIKIVSIALGFFFICSCTHSLPLSGYWIGSMEMKGKTVDLSIDFNMETFSSYDLMIVNTPISHLKYKQGTIRFSHNVFDADVNFDGAIKNDTISGSVNIPGMPPELKCSFELTRISDFPPQKPYVVESVFVAGVDEKIAADIYKPKSDIPHPALVLMHGSSGYLKNNLAFYADFFAVQGFEVLIFDKRGNGLSRGNSIAATYENLAEDVIACLEAMQKRASVDKAKIGLWGISQGGMLLPFVASKTNIPSFLIAVSPDVNGAYEAAAFSDSLRLINLGNSPADGHIAAESHRRLAEMIREGKSYKKVESYISENARQYDFMNQTGLYSNAIIDEEHFEGLYWSGRKYNFCKDWKNLNIPTLCIFGEDDAFVDPVSNEGILKRFNNPKIDTKMFPQANHVLKKTFNPVKYPDFDWPRVAPGYLDYVKTWIGEYKNKSK